MKTYKNTFDKIIEVDNFYASLNAAARGKRGRYSCLKFLESRYSNIKALRESVMDGTYSPLPPSEFTVLDPKPRNISAPKFRDRIVQHAIYRVLYPIFDKTFLPNSYACRKGKGTHLASKHVQASLRRNRGGWYLKTDFSKYFHTINRKILWEAINRKIGCYQTKELLSKFIPREGVGLKIGELLSQLFANVFGNIVDMHLKHTLGVKEFFRYMDDIVIIGESREQLLNIKCKLERFCKSIGLRFSRWHIHPISRGVNFVGYRIWATHKLIRKDSIARAKRKLRTLSPEAREAFLNSWSGHLKHADTYNLKRRLGI